MGLAEVTAEGGTLQRDGAQGQAGAAARGGAINAIGSIAATVFGFGLVLIVTNAYGDVRSGTFFAAVAVFSMCGQTVKLGADTGLVFSLPRMRAAGLAHRQHHMTLIALAPVLVVSSLVGALLVVGDDTIARWLVADVDADQRGDFANVLRALGWFLPGWALTQVLLGGTRGMGSMVPMAAVQHIGRNAAQFVGVAVAAAVGWTGTALGLAWAAPLAVTAMVASVWLTQMLDASADDAAEELARHDAALADAGGSGAAALAAEAGVPSEETGSLSSTLDEPDASRSEEPAMFGESTAELAVPFWRFSLPRGLSAMFNVMLEKADVPLVQRYASAADAGVYGATARLINAGYLLAFSVGQAVSPQFSSMFARKAYDEIKDLYQTVVGWMVVFVWPIYLGFIVFGEPVLGLFGGEFAVGSSALAITSVAMLTMLLLGPGDFLLLMSGRTWQSFMNVGFALGLNLGLNRVLIPEMGLEGAALAWAIGIIVSALLPLFQNWRAFDVHPFRVETLRAAGVAAVVVGGGLSLARLIGGATLPAAILGGVIVLAMYGLVISKMADDLRLDRFVGAVKRKKR